MPATEPEFSDAWHSHPVRVYYEDTDAQGVVYFANYLRFMERGRTEWLRAHGVSQRRLMLEQNLCFGLLDTNIRFLAPARFDDRLAVMTRVTEIRGARVQFEQAVRRESAEGDLLASADCIAACLAADSYRPRRLPADLFSREADTRS
jgi:acyl-CoA thioester hydrolase